MKKAIFYLAILAVFTACAPTENKTLLNSNISTESKALLDSDKYIYVYVDGKKSITLNEEKSSITKLEQYLQTTSKKQAKIGTLRPIPMDIFPEFERVVQLMKDYQIESEWYADKKFSIPFFE